MPFTGGAPQVVSDVFTRVDNLAATLREDAREALEAAGLVVAATIPNPTENPTLTQLTTTPARPANLELISIGQVISDNAAVRTRLENTILTRLTDYFATIFPFDGNLAAASAWVNRILTNQGGLDPAFEERIWERERNRAQRDAVRASDEVLSTWAARGYALPPGGAAGALALIQRTQLEQSAASSRDVAIKTYETEIALMKDAVDTAIRLRVESITNAAEYVKLATIEPLLINEVQQGTTEIQNKLVNAATEFFKLDSAFNSYRYEKDKDFIDFARQYQKFQYDVNLAQLDKRVNLALENAKMAATQAAAALNGLHASAAISGSDSTVTQL